MVRRPLRVLIVEDDPDVREFMDILLSSAGYDTVTAGHGGEALESMRARLPDIVLLDLQMPVVDGFQFRAQQLSDSALSRVPVVCVTAAFDLDDVGARLGTPCIRKPLDIGAMLEQIRAVCPKELGALHEPEEV